MSTRTARQPKIQKVEAKCGTKANHQKVVKTVRGALKKAYYYLAAKYDYELTESIFSRPKDGTLLITTQGKTAPDSLVELYTLDSLIRETDDLLDNTLAKQQPLPVDAMRREIARFLSACPEEPILLTFLRPKSKFET